MLRKRALTAALALLVGVTLQTAQAAPRRTAQLRAKRCCATRCRPAVSLGRAMQCCHVPADTGTTVTLSAAKTSPQAALVWVAAASQPAPIVRHEIACPGATATSCRAGPLYLRTGSLRL